MSFWCSTLLLFPILKCLFVSEASSSHWRSLNSEASQDSQRTSLHGGDVSDVVLVQHIIDVILVQHIIGDHIEASLAEQEDLKCKLWSFVSSFTGQTWMTGHTMMMLYKGHNRPRRSERPEVQSAGLVQESAGRVQESAGLVQEPTGLAQESSAQRLGHNKHAQLERKPRAQRIQDVDQTPESAKKHPMSTARKQGRRPR